MAAKISRETQEQITVCDWLRVKMHPVTKKKLINYTSHAPNEGKRSYFVAWLLKRMGLRKGISDLFIAIPTMTHPGLWIEMKIKPNKPTKEQKEFLEDMGQVGYATKICYSADEAIETINDYLKNLKPLTEFLDG